MMADFNIISENQLIMKDKQTESMRKWSFIFTLLAHLPKLLKSISGRM